MPEQAYAKLIIGPLPAGLAGWLMERAIGWLGDHRPGHAVDVELVWAERPVKEVVPGRDDRA